MNADGQLGHSLGLGSSAPRARPIQLARSNFSGHVVVSVSMSTGHTIVQTKENATVADVRAQSAGAVTQVRPTWVWGSNSHGQLGGTAKARLGGGGSAPELLSPALFPEAQHGNEIVDEKSGAFAVIKWNTSCSCPRQTNASLPQNRCVSWDMLDDYIDEEAVTFSLGADHRIHIEVKPGYQLDLVIGATLAARLGFQPCRIPAQGVFKEVSARLQNHQLRYKYFSGKLQLDDYTRIFQYRAWSAGGGRAETYEVSLPAEAYTPAELVRRLNDGAAANGHYGGIVALAGNPSEYGEKIGLRVSTLSGRLLFLGDQQAALLGGAFPPKMPEPDLFHHSTEYLAVPNEVSASAGTSRIEYKYLITKIDDRYQVRSFDLEVGVKTVEEVQQVLSDTLVQRHSSTMSNAADAVRLYMDAEDFVVIEVVQERFQFLFAESTCGGRFERACNQFSDNVRANTIAKYLGFAREHFPEDLLLESGTTSNVTVTFSSVRKRAAEARPLISLHKAIGSCSGVCACRINGNAPTATCLDYTSSADSIQVVSSGNCSCVERNTYIHYKAQENWGVVNPKILTFPDGVYTVQQLNLHLRQHLASEGFPELSFTFYSNSDNNALTCDITQRGFVINFTASSVSSFLGFDGTLPLDGAFTELDRNPTEWFTQGVQNPPILAESLRKYATWTGEYIVKASAGKHHSIVQTYNSLNHSTRVWAFGSNQFGQLGCKYNAYTDNFISAPCLIRSNGNFDASSVLSMAAGDTHSALLDKNGRVFLFGSDSHGQLGTGSHWNATGQYADYIPRQLNSISGSIRWRMVILGSQHTVVIGSNIESSSDTSSKQVWAFGSNEFGQLGTSGNQEADYANPVPQRVSDDVNASWETGCAGSGHTLLLDNKQRLWATGFNGYGQAGVSGQEHEIHHLHGFHRVGVTLSRSQEVTAVHEEFTSEQVREVACGAYHSLVLTEQGNLWSFGLNLFGQLISTQNLGLGNSNSRPKVVDTGMLASDGVNDQPIMKIFAAGDNCIVQTSRELCLPGHWSQDGLQPCYKCEPGTFVNESGATSCSLCSKGFFSPPASSQCLHCPKGYYSDEVGLGVCKKCPSDRSYTTKVAATNISNCSVPCDAGTAAPTGAQPCTVCSQGTYSELPAATSCTPCEIGTYQPENRSTSCHACPAGQSTANISSQFIGQCRQICSPGSYGLNGLAESRFTNGNESRRCNPCPRGHYSAANRSHSCTACSFHSYQEGTGMSVCVMCPDGKGTEEEGTWNATKCFPFCDPGFVSSTSVEPCRPCSHGTYSPLKGLKLCLQCAAGNFSTAGSSSCAMCPPGRISESSGSGNCTACPRGKYQSESGRSECKNCPRGFYADQVNSTACIQCAASLDTTGEGSDDAGNCSKLCPEGSYSSDGLLEHGRPCSNCTAGMASYSNGESAWPKSCLNCTPGYYSMEAGAYCLKCANGTYSSQTAASACLLCAAGTSSMMGATVCSQCPGGTYADSPGLPRCLLCPKGKFQTNSGFTECQLCPRGSYSSAFGSSQECPVCIEGKYSPAAGLAECLNCSAGSFSNASNMSACTECQPGQYSDQIQSVMCFPCAAGTFSNTSAATVCEVCDAGFAAQAQSTSCSLCAHGTWSNGSLAQCQSCPSGYNTTSPGSTSLSKCFRICLPGHFGNYGLSPSSSESCSPCSKGSFAPGEYSRSCNPCPAGSYAHLPGMHVCEACDPGTFSSGTGSSQCANCPAGTFAEYVGTVNCSQCPGGKYMDGTGASACKECGYGAYSSAGASTCQECGPLKSTAFPTATSAGDCIAFCPTGTYGLDNGVASSINPCNPCTPGSFNNFSKQSTCMLCPAGKFSNVSGALECHDCPLDTWQNESGSTFCQPCPIMDSVCETCPSNFTRTRLPGSAAVTECRVYSTYECRNSPRRLGKYPIYAAGDNSYGQSLGATLFESMLRPLATCEMFENEEVSQMRSSGEHSIAQTTEYTPSHPTRFRNRLWSWGLNNHGQLGTPGAGSKEPNPTPATIPRFLFPSLQYGNTISQSAGNNRFYYFVWDSELEQKVPFNVTIPDGVFAPTQIMTEVSSQMVAQHGHPPHVFQTIYHAPTQGLIFRVARPGFQADFGHNDTMAGNLGFNTGFRFPMSGTVNEVSAAAGNNVFRYRHWCAFPGYVNGSGCGSNFSTFTLTLPDGLYTTEDLFEQVNVFSINNGHGELTFYFYMADDHVSMVVYTKGLQVDFTGDDTIANFLGFDKALYPSSGPTDSTENIFTAQSARGNLNVGVGSSAFKPAWTFTAVEGEEPEDFMPGGTHTIVRTSGLDGSTRLWAFGSNRFGQLGSSWNAGRYVPNTTPHLISHFDERNGGLKAVRFSAGEHHTMVETDDRSLWVFGSNRFGQLGLPVNVGLLVPNWEPLLWNYPGRGLIAARFALLGDWSLGADHSLVTMTDGDSGEATVFAFGSNEHGQLAHRGAFNVDSSLINASLLPATAGLCWQQNASVSCRSVWDNSPAAVVPVANHIPLPVVVSSSSASVSASDLNIVMARAGGFHTLVVTRDGRLWCAGSNTYGQCGGARDLSLDSTSLVYPPAGHTQYVLRAVGFRYAFADTGAGTKSGFILPDPLCCAPRRVGSLNSTGLGGSVAGCQCAKGLWSFRGSCVPCPFGGKHIRNVFAASAHTLVQTTESVWYSFGLNANGQLLRYTPNLGTSNANSDVAVISRFLFGDSNQVFMNINAGSTADHSLAQTYRDFCRPGNHSIDRRSPCERCLPGGFTASKGALTEPFYSFDQSVEHPYSPRYTIRYRMKPNTLEPELAEPVMLNCLACEAGKFSLTNSSYCSLCPAGTYSFGGASTCHKCPPGTYSNASSSANCTLCALGKSSLVGETVCFECGLGQYADVLGSEFCKDCDIGKYADKTGTAECYPCDSSSYQNETGSSTCVLCPADMPTTARFGATASEMCQTLCPTGTSGDKFGDSTAAMINCKPCPNGKYGRNDNITGGMGALACRDCAPGKFSPVDANQSVTGAPWCTDCAGGKYIDTFAATACLNCPATTFSPVGSTMCLDCIFGKFSVGGQELCTLCSPGKAQPNNKSSSCTNCTGGKFSSSIGASACSQCSPGTVSREGAIVCSPCDAGLFQRHHGQTACNACLAGTFSNSGSSVCSECRPGNFSWGPLLDGGGAVRCSMCAPGSFSASNASSNCTLCPAGSFGASRMMSVCDLCVSGYFSPKRGYSVCESCTPGSFR